MKHKNLYNNSKININLTYPHNPYWDYITLLERINIDKQREEDIRTGRGFIINGSTNIKKAIKNKDGIFDIKFGSNSIADSDSFTYRYRCKCGAKKGHINNGELCHICNTRVMYVDDDVTKTGYLVIPRKDIYVIHPNLYCALEAFIGVERLTRIIKPDIQVDCDGNEMEIIPIKADEPFRGIGIIEFKERFDEIMEFYLKKYPNKENIYNDIMKNKDIIFIQSIPVYSSLLRPIDVNNGSLKYEETNGPYFMLHRIFTQLANDKLGIERKSKARLELLYDAQYQIKSLYNKIRDMLSKKKGDIRSAIGGRYSFSSRSVIVQDIDLKADQVRLPFAGLCELLQQLIINILVRSYHCTYADAYKKWYKAQINGYDKIVYDIIDGLIKDTTNGLPVLINRNPTIAYGGILSCKVIGINMDYTMSVSLLDLPAMAADFDGDTLNIMYLYNKDFIRLADMVINPRQMFISRNNGRCNSDFVHGRDIIINSNAAKSLYNYNIHQINKIRALQSISADVY